MRRGTGFAGSMLRQVIAQAAQLKAERQRAKAPEKRNVPAPREPVPGMPADGR